MSRRRSLARILELEEQVRQRDLELARLQFLLEQAVPDVEDSPAWSATTPTLEGDKPTTGQLQGELNLALVRVLTYGDKLRRCQACGEPSTNSFAFEYEWRGDETAVRITETCQACRETFVFAVSAQAWACMEAMRAWEGIRTASALFKSELEGAKDLERLDQDGDQRSMRDVALQAATARGIPKALMHCAVCSHWIEPRDGTLACECPTPIIGEKE